MHRPNLICLLGFTLAGWLALSIGTRPSIKAQQSPAIIAANAVGGAFGGGKQDDEQAMPPVYLPPRPMTIAETKTRLKLHEKITMNFPNDTPLEDVKKYLEQTTIDKTDFPEGISIYVDPQGLQDAEKTMAVDDQDRTEEPPAGNDPFSPLEAALADLLDQQGWALDHHVER